MAELITPRLLLLPDSPARLRALRDGPDAFLRVAGVKLASGLAAYWSEASPEYLAKALAEPPPPDRALGFLVVHRDDRLLIGMCSFKAGRDQHGMAEIAYGIAPAYQGRGYATEAATAVIEEYFRDPQALVVRAHTLPEPGPSARVLTKCGFRLLGEVIDPDDGRVWRWERGRPG